MQILEKADDVTRKVQLGPVKIGQEGVTLQEEEDHNNEEVDEKEAEETCIIDEREMKTTRSRNMNGGPDPRSEEHPIPGRRVFPKLQDLCIRILMLPRSRSLPS